MHGALPLRTVFWLLMKSIGAIKFVKEIFTDRKRDGIPCDLNPGDDIFEGVWKQCFRTVKHFKKMTSICKMHCHVKYKI